VYALTEKKETIQGAHSSSRGSHGAGIVGGKYASAAYCILCDSHRQLVPADFAPGPYLNNVPQGSEAVNEIRIERIPLLAVMQGGE